VRPVSALSIALGALVLTPACYDLPHADPGPRWIDQFRDAAMPTWGVFAPWTCGTERVMSPALGGSDAGSADAAPTAIASADAAIADTGDGGLRMPCQSGPGDGDGPGLEQPFAFADSSNNLEFTVATQAASPVDFTGFHQFVFSANLSTPSTAPLPTGTVFSVELECTKNPGETVLTQNVGITINAQGWDTFRLYLAQFTAMLTSSNGSCLSQIDVIRFVVKPGKNNRPEVAETLSLDNISLQN